MKHLPIFLLLISLLVSCKSTKSTSNRSGDILWSSPLTAHVEAPVEKNENFSDAAPLNISDETLGAQKILKYKTKSKSKADAKLTQAKSTLKAAIQIKKQIKKIKHASKVSEGAPIDGFALAGFLCGLLGMLLLFTFLFPFFMGTLAVIFSAIGLSRTGEAKSGKGFAIAGLIIGILTILLFWLILAALVTLIAAIV